MKKPVIKLDAIGTRLPIYPTIIFWLLAKQFNVPSWFWGMFWTLVVVLWLYGIYMLGRERACTPIYREDLKPGSHMLLFPEKGKEE